MNDAPDTTGTVVFHVQRGSLFAARLGPLLLVMMSAGVIHLYTQLENGFDEPWISGGLAVFLWGLLIVGVVGPLLIAAFYWRRVPLGAGDGVLRIGPEGVLYHVGPFRQQIGWSQVAAVHPVTPDGAAAAKAIWLPKTETGPISRARHAVLVQALYRQPAAPLLRDDGVMLPIGLFGAHNARHILAAVENRLAARL